MIGHNGGPGVEPGQAWRLHCWRKARADLLPTLPIEVLRLRVARAKALGLDYRTYASVRAATGHDVVAFLFSSNALRVTPARPVLPRDRAEVLESLRDALRIGLACGRLTPQALGQNPGLDSAHVAPAHLASFAAARQVLRGAIGRMPSDRVLLVGDMTLEAEWATAGRLAGYLPAERYFAGAALAFGLHVG